MNGRPPAGGRLCFSRPVTARRRKKSSTKRPIEKHGHYRRVAYHTRLDALIPAAKIANLSQGMFVGAVSDNFGEAIEQKVFHAQIVVDNEKVAAEMKAYQQIPVINDFLDDEGNDIMREQIQYNYDKVKVDVLEIVENELERIKNDPNLKHLLGEDDKDDDEK